jgi:alanine dehydrogenase
MSEIAGRLAPLIAGQLLTSTTGGRGTLLGGLPGVPPAAVVILGGGVLGTHAARAFVGLGTQVTVLDHDIRCLQRLDERFGGRVTTMLANDYSLNRVVDFADVVVGAVLSPGRRAPVLLTRKMVHRMRSGSVLLDFAIDQGGCAETSRPTTLRDPTFTTEETIHYCVPNATATVARTTSYAITNVVVPYLLTLGDGGENAGIQTGLNTKNGISFHNK